MTQQKKPRLLDLFSGAGGAARGYHDAGFDVVGVDLYPQKQYPYEFHQADALTYPLDGFDVIHASPPCQYYSITSSLWRKAYPDLIAQVRERLKATQKPYIIENVPGSPLQNYVLLCGSMFGLHIRRHRWFELSIGWRFSPFSCHHEYRAVQCFGKSNRRDNALMVDKKREMGIDWMNEQELSQAIPPAYTRWIGEQLMPFIQAGVEVAS